MSKGLITKQYLTDIADAIREKTGEDKLYLPSEMAEAVRSIEGGSSDYLNITYDIYTLDTSAANASIGVDIYENGSFKETRTIVFNKLVPLTSYRNFSTQYMAVLYGQTASCWTLKFNRAYDVINDGVVATNVPAATTISWNYSTTKSITIKMRVPITNKVKVDAVYTGLADYGTPSGFPTTTYSNYISHEVQNDGYLLMSYMNNNNKTGYLVIEKNGTRILDTTDKHIVKSFQVASGDIIKIYNNGSTISAVGPHVEGAFIFVSGVSKIQIVSRYYADVSTKTVAYTVPEIDCSKCIAVSSVNSKSVDSTISNRFSEYAVTYFSLSTINYLRSTYDIIDVFEGDVYPGDKVELRQKNNDSETNWSYQLADMFLLG